MRSPVTQPEARRTRAETAMALFCGLTLVFLMYRDLALPEVGGVEVWLGLELHDGWARATAPIHWAIYAAGGLAFWRGWPPAWGLAMGYALYVAFSHLVWNLTSDVGGGLIVGLIHLIVFTIPALAIALLGRSSKR